MIDYALDLLDGSTRFTQKLPQIIQIFIDFYGLEKSDRIIECFQNFFPIFISKPEEKMDIIINAKHKLSEQMSNQFLKNHHLHSKHQRLVLPPELDNIGYDFMDLYEIYVTIQLLPSTSIRSFLIEKNTSILQQHYGSKLTSEDITRLAQERKIANLLSSINKELYPFVTSVFNGETLTTIIKNLEIVLGQQLKKLYPQIDFTDFGSYYQNRHSNILKDIDLMLDDYLQMRNDYLKEIAPLKPYEEYCEQAQKLKDKYFNQALYNLIIELSSSFPKEEIAEIENQFHHQQILNLNHLPYLYAYLGDGLDCPSSLLSSFSKENNRLLATFLSQDKIEDEGSIPDEWVVDNIMQERMYFFKRLGINHNTYQEYIGDLDCQKITPTYDIVNKVENLRHKYCEQAKIAFYQALPDYQKILKTLENLNLLDVNHGFDVDTYDNVDWSIFPNARRTDKGLIAFPIAVFRLLDTNYANIDLSIIHELNHIYELLLKADDSTKTIFTCGWEQLEHSKGKIEVTTLQDDKNIVRHYELFCESINEKLAIDITNTMHQRGIYIFNDPNEENQYDDCSYEELLFLVDEFYEKNFPDIIESRAIGSLEPLFAKLGKDNIEELNALFNLYHEKIGSDPDSDVLSDIEDGVVNEQTKIYNQIIDKRDEVLQAMAEYQKTKKLSITLQSK